MLSRLWYLAIAILAVAVTLNAGWLTPVRLGGVAVLALAAVCAWLALRATRPHL